MVVVARAGALWACGHQLWCVHVLWVGGVVPVDNLYDTAASAAVAATRIPDSAPPERSPGHAGGATAVLPPASGGGGTVVKLW